MTALVAIVTVLILLFYFWTSIEVGKARRVSEIHPPTMTGHPTLERAVRVHMNTLEWLVIFLPAMWLCAAYVHPVVAALLGLAWICGRYIYMRAYMKEPKTRSTGFAIQGLATAAALFSGLVGAVISIFTGGGGS